MLKKIWEPLHVRNLSLPNRIIMGAMHLGIEGSDSGIEKLISFYVERAKGGVGLIITGGIAVNLEAAGGKDFLYLHKDESIQELLQLTTAVHQAGGRIAAQLFHAGRYSDKRGTGLDPVAPSPLKATINEFPPRELSQEEILQTIEDFAQAAIRAKMAGFDAVEIMGSEGYLINQFLSPLTNQRTDNWGGNYQNRSRFALNIVKKVRQAVGEHFPIIFRMSGIDLMPNSTNWQETILFARDLEQADVDILNIGIGWHESKVPTIAMFVPRGSYAWVAAKIRNNVDIPVIASNRINKLELAEEILRKDQADLISMARPFLADPFLLAKANQGNLEDIQTCVACNQACLDHIFTGKPVSCVVNPYAGREWKKEWEFKYTEKPKNIAVIGGGPAGLEAARVLAERGHNVTIFEQQKTVGGQLNYARLIPGKEEWGETLQYYDGQIKKLNISLELGKHVTFEDVIDKNFDHIIVATGSKMKKPEIKGVNLPHVITYHDVFADKDIIGKNVVIIGGGGIAIDVVHYLLAKNISIDMIRYLSEYKIIDSQDLDQLIQNDRNITIMRRKGKIGASLGRTTRWAVLDRLQQKGVNMYTGIEYKEISENGVTIQYKEEKLFLPADTIILATGQEENNELYHKIKKTDIPVTVVGGAKTVEELNVKIAIYDGGKIGRSI